MSDISQSQHSAVPAVVSHSTTMEGVLDSEVLVSRCPWHDRRAHRLPDSLGT